ncbi:hypothetical protein MYX07_01800 [Patescibacteria group bacterium AH-259-L07]|nr:hypothetical protein [Patescibacteria group bacterium AH-259-L07]
MRHTLIFAVMIGFIASAVSQTVSEDSTETQRKSLITVYKNRAFQYGKQGFLFLKNTAYTTADALIYAYENDNTITGWNPQVDFVYVDLRWDAHMADEWTYSYTVFEKIPQHQKEHGKFYADYGTAYKPIVVRFSNKVRPTVGASYRWKQWALGARVWHFSQSARLAGEVRSIGRTVTVNEDGSILTEASYTGIKMWGHSLFPLINTLFPEGVTPVVWSTENGLNIWFVDIYTSYQVTSNFDFIAALKVIDVVNRQKLGQKHWAYTPYGGGIWDNHVTLAQTAEARYRAVGPMIGFHFHQGPFEASYQTGTLSSNNLLQDGHWDDVDKINYFYADSTTLYWDILYNGDFPYSHKARADIGVEELSLKVNSPDFDPVKGVTATFLTLSRLTNKFNTLAQFTSRFENKILVKFGLGWTRTTLKQTPIAPRWTVRGDWTSGEGTYWALRTQDLVLQGASVSVALSF